VALGLADRLLEERQRLADRVEQQIEQLDRLRQIVEHLAERLDRDERLLEELDSLLGKAAQLRLEELDPRLRGQRLEEIAIRILLEDRGPRAEVHYREWFELLRARGLRVSGKDPLGTFLAQINRSPSVQRVGRRTGRYKLLQAA
jgi:hypothetical protein